MSLKKTIRGLSNNNALHFCIVSMFLSTACSSNSKDSETVNEKAVTTETTPGNKTENPSGTSGGGNSPKKPDKVQPAKSENVPGLTGSLAIEFPGSVEKKNGTAAALKGFGLMTDSSDDSLNGFENLQNAAFELESQVAELSLEMLKLESIYKEVDAACGANWTVCERAAGAHKIPVTAPMIAAFVEAEDIELTESNTFVIDETEYQADQIQDAIDNGVLTEDVEFIEQAAELLDALVQGNTLESPKLKIQKLSTPTTQGCTIEYDAEISEFEKISVCWNADQSIVYSERSFSYSSDTENSEGSESNGMQAVKTSYDGKLAILYDKKANKMISNAIHDSVNGTEVNSFRQNFTVVSANDEKETVSGNLKTEFSSSTGIGQGSVSSDFSLSNNGGFIRSTFEIKDVTINSNLVNGNTVLNKYYVIAPSNASASTMDWPLYLGEGFGSGSTSLEGLTYVGPVPAPSALKLFTVDYSAEGNVWSDSGLTVSLTAVTSFTKTTYNEAFDAEGNLIFVESCESENQCVTLSGSEGLAEEFETEFNSEYAEFESQETRLVLGSTSAFALKGENLVLVAGTTDLSTFDPESAEYFEFQLGDGYFNGSSDNLPADSTEGYVLSWWGDESKISSAKVYRLTFNATTGKSEFVLVMGATLSKQ